MTYTYRASRYFFASNSRADLGVEQFRFLSNDRSGGELFVAVLVVEDGYNSLLKNVWQRGLNGFRD